MKKSLFIVAALVVVGMSSCRKERVCECTSQDDSPGSVASTEKVTYTKAKKNVCSSSSNKRITTAPAAPSGYTYYTTTTTCTLK
jgi:hypothetical protein